MNWKNYIPFAMFLIGSLQSHAADVFGGAKKESEKPTSTVVSGVFKITLLELSQRAKSDQLVGFKFTHVPENSAIESQRKAGDAVALTVGPAFVFFTTQQEADVHFAGQSQIRLRALLVETTKKVLEAEQLVVFKKSERYGEVPITLFSRTSQQSSSQLGSSGSILDMHLPSSDYVVF